MEFLDSRKDVRKDLIEGRDVMSVSHVLVIVDHCEASKA